MVFGSFLHIDVERNLVPLELMSFGDKDIEVMDEDEIVSLVSESDQEPWIAGAAVSVFPKELLILEGNNFPFASTQHLSLIHISEPTRPY